MGVRTAAAATADDDCDDCNDCDDGDDGDDGDDCDNCDACVEHDACAAVDDGTVGFSFRAVEPAPAGSVTNTDRRRATGSDGFWTGMNRAS